MTRFCSVTRCCRPTCDHFQYLAKLARRHSVENVQNTADELHSRAHCRVSGHDVGRSGGGYDSDGANDVWDKAVHVFPPTVGHDQRAAPIDEAWSCSRSIATREQREHGQYGPCTLRKIKRPLCQAHSTAWTVSAIHITQEILLRLRAYAMGRDSLVWIDDLFLPRLTTLSRSQALFSI